MAKQPITGYEKSDLITKVLRQLATEYGDKGAFGTEVTILRASADLPDHSKARLYDILKSAE